MIYSAIMWQLMHAEKPASQGLELWHLCGKPRWDLKWWGNSSVTSKTYPTKPDLFLNCI